MRDHWGYTGPVDGVPGTNTWAAVQRLAAAHGYTGPIDGAMGPNSWRGFARFLNQDTWD
jgi:peptidoglycan hydrolase-like protein with peptidoglycan-binding domain